MQLKPIVRYPIRLITLASVLALSQAGCGIFGSSEQAMSPNTDNRAGQGTVDVEEGDNGNTRLEVEVKHLAAPAKMAPDASIYVVWVKPRSGAIQNVGALEVDDDLTGSLETTTPHKAFTLSVTPEPSARVAEPSHAPVFTSEVNRDD